MPSDDFEMLTVKGTSYRLSNYPQGPYLGPFFSTTSRFRHTRLTKVAKIGHVPSDLKMSLST